MTVSSSAPAAGGTKAATAATATATATAATATATAATATATATATAATATAATGWTCPFCPWLCDGLGVRATASGALELSDGRCAAAAAGLAHFSATPSDAVPTLAGAPCEPAAAVAAAARLLAASRQPLFGGLATDVAGARAVYRLACDTGAICDPHRGRELMHGVRALQDRGGFSTTLAEVRARADLIVCIGEMPDAAAVDFLARSGIGVGEAARHLVALGGAPADAARITALAQHGRITTETIALHGDLYATVAALAAISAGHTLPGAPAPLAALAERLHAAQYAVLVGATHSLPGHGALIVEGVNRIVDALNDKTRAAALWIGTDAAVATVNQAVTWMSGLPLRSRAGPLGLEHEPVCFDAERLLDDAAVDCVLWVSSFDPACAPPATALPLIVLGHPALGAAAARTGSVFIPVSTPGIGSPGHLFRTDGGAVLPLPPLYADRLPTAADVLERIRQALQAVRAEASA